MTTSLAAVFDGAAGQIDLRQIPTPEPRGAELLVRVLGCTLCGSDLHSFEGRRTVPVPTVLGHEIVGEVVAVGESAPTRDLGGDLLRMGDRVTWAIVASCGDCFYCRRGLPQKCLRMVKYGHEAFRPGRELLGGLAEHCLLVPGTGIVRLPDDLPLSVACPASCATATVAAATEAAGDLRDRTVCVLGAGLLGLTACAMTRAAGASQAICVDRHAGRRERSLRFGATHAAAPEELTDLVNGLTERHGVDALLEFTGATAAFTAAWPLVRIGGRVVLVGSVFPDTPVPIALEQIVRRHLTLRGIHNYAPRHLVTAVQFLADQHARFPFAELVAAWHPLGSIRDAFTQAADPQAIRIGVGPTAGG
jgi:putative phosphonate catabolism associated alcohol dehydrogenase